MACIRVYSCVHPMDFDNYMTSWKRQNYRHTKKINGCQEFGWGEGGRDD